MRTAPTFDKLLSDHLDALCSRKTMDQLQGIEDEYAALQWHLDQARQRLAAQTKPRAEAIPLTQPRAA